MESTLVAGTDNRLPSGDLRDLCWSRFFLKKIQPEVILFCGLVVPAQLTVQCVEEPTDVLNERVEPMEKA